LILPYDEVMIEFAKKHLSDCQVEFRKVFIRWNKINTTSDEEVPAGTVVTSDQFAREIMNQCHEIAQLSSDWWRQVGAVAVRDGKPLMWGLNRQQPTDYSQGIDGDIRLNFGFGERVEICGPIHAEGEVIASAARVGLALAGADLYCTTFPCPACARLIAKSGVLRVIYQTGYSVCDAWDILKQVGVEVVKFVP
jgi:dCMP deaminase